MPLGDMINHAADSVDVAVQVDYHESSKMTLGFSRMPDMWLPPG